MNEERRPMQMFDKSGAKFLSQCWFSYSLECKSVQPVSNFLQQLATTKGSVQAYVHSHVYMKMR